MATHPIDATLRDQLRRRLKELGEHKQKELAKRIGRSQGWLNKYINGGGKATIDDAIRLTAIVWLAVDREPLTTEERKLVREWRASAPDEKQILKNALALCRATRHARRAK